jgi:hypothetical protein
MLIELTCSCGKRLKVSDEFAGRQGQCPACGGQFQIPGRDATVTSVAPSADDAAQAVVAAPGLAGAKGPGAPEDAVTPPAGSAANLHEGERGGPPQDDKAKPTVAGCVLLLLSVAVIFVVALPILRWRHPATGEAPPLEIAILVSVLIGAAVHGIGSLLLRSLGLPIWAKRELDVERPGRSSRPGGQAGTAPEKIDGPA